MPTINASKYGYMNSSASGTGAFATVRGASSATGTVVNQSSSNNQFTVRANLGFSSKGDSATLSRTWWAFDVTSYQSGFTITDLQLQFDPTTNTSTNFPIIVIKSTAQGNADTNLTAADWNNFDTGTTYTTTSTNNFWPDTNSISTIDLNSTAIAAFSTGYLKVCIQWVFDFNGIGALSNFNGQGVINYSYTPRIVFTAVASGYDKTTNGVTIEEEEPTRINDVLISSIEKLNDVS